MAATLARALGLSEAKVQAALTAVMPQGTGGPGGGTNGGAPPSGTAPSSPASSSGSTT
jgi:hypothetical protein